MKKLFFTIPFLFLLFSCSSSQTKTKVSDAVEQAQSEFFTKKHSDEVVFRMFISSEAIKTDQVKYKDSIRLTADPGGDQALVEQIGRYDLVDVVSEGEIMVELYPNSGDFYRLRQVHPSHVVEIDKIISQDITRLRFEFPQKVVRPTRFHVVYGYILQNKKSREEAKEILEEHAR